MRRFARSFSVALLFFTTAIISSPLAGADDLAAGFRNPPHSAGIRALRRCELIVLDRKALEQLLKKDPEVVYQVMRSIVRAAHRILGRMNAQFVEMSNYISKQHGRY
jgi:CRP-like cAMP-binding protein